MTFLARTPIFADPRLDSRLVELPGAGGEALTPEDDAMRKFSELLQIGDYAAARQHPQYLGNVRVGEQLIAAADQRRKEELCGHHSSPMREPPRIAGAEIDAARLRNMQALSEQKKHYDGMYA